MINKPLTLRKDVFLWHETSLIPIKAFKISLLIQIPRPIVEFSSQ
jgi:hypothetical protein